MGAPQVLHAALVAHLQTLPNVEVFDTDVPTSPPAEPGTGRVWPYAVVWPTGGHADPHARTVDGDTHGALAWPVQITVAAGDPGWCLAAVGAVRAHVEGLVLTPGAGPLREDPVALQVQPDRDVNPPRWFLPLLFRTQAP